MNKRSSFTKDENGTIIPYKVPHDINETYLEAVTRYLNYLEPLFEKAREKSEVQFIITLLHFRGMESEGWDPYENSLRIYEVIQDTIQKSKNSDLRINLSLWLYGHIVEASEPYEVIANLLNIIDGGAFITNNFPKKQIGNRLRSLYPREKIEILEVKANKVGIPEVVVPIKDIYDSELRNAVFHSDYAVYEGGVRLRNPDKEYSHKKTLEIINKSFAYHEVMKNLLSASRASYTEPVVIEDASSISDDPECKITVIMRKGHGVIGFRDSWTDEEIKMGKIPFYLGRRYAYEKRYIDKRIALLPRDRIDLANKFFTTFS